MIRLTEVCSKNYLCLSISSFFILAIYYIFHFIFLIEHPFKYRLSVMIGYACFQMSDVIISETAIDFRGPSSRTSAKIIGHFSDSLSPVCPVMSKTNIPPHQTSMQNIEIPQSPRVE